VSNMGWLLAHRPRAVRRAFARIPRLQSDDWLRDPRARVADRVGLLLGQRDPLLPPAGLFADPDRVDGSHDVREFVMVGEETVSWLIEQGLEPTDAVLEIGCGIGRMAMPLVRHLREGGSYDGVEIDPAKVEYCRRTAGRVGERFRFHHADVHSTYYNPQGRWTASEYRFPFDDASFDFVFLVSVFTHMLPGDMEHYLAEIARVMRPGATCSTSFWLSREPLGEPYQRWSDVADVYRVDEPEHGVVFREDHVVGVLADLGLRVERLWRGSRFGHEDPDHNPSSQQDILILTKD
jgi:SAM-dependent methyltransferase